MSTEENKTKRKVGVHSIDQAMAMWRDVLEQAPPLLFNFNKGLIEAGFKEDKALLLTAEALKKMINPN